MRVTAGGVRWQVAPECRDELLGPDGLRLAEWLGAGQAAVVKHGPHRTVYRVALDAGSVYVKHYRLADARAWLRQLVRPAKARMEFDRAVRVAARQVPTTVPLAVGECGPGPGESYLVTRSLDDAEPLTAFLEATLPALDPTRHARVRQRLAVVLGELVARLHEAGIAHHDLHAGNVLVRLEADDRPAVYLIDLHAVHVGRPLPWRARQANLVLLNRWFMLRASRSDRRRFWRAYAAAGGAPPPSDPDDAWRVRRLEGATWDSCLRFWQHRDRRCLQTNRYYVRARSAAAAGFAVRDLDPADLAGLLADPDAPFRRPGAPLLKDSRSSTVAEIDVTVNGRPCRAIYKRFRVTAWCDPWLNLLRPSEALRSWVHGQGLRERCLPTPRPLAVFHRRRRGLQREGYLLTEKVPAAADLHAHLAGLGGRDAAERRAVLLRRRIDEAAKLVRELHRRQLSHRDLKAANLLVNPAGLWLIDLVGVRLHRRLPRRRRVQNLARLNASFHQSPLLTRTDRLRFLRVYLQWGLFGRHRWKRWWRQIEEATRAKVARNARSGRPLA
jgi:tRNA A-37 threonylcarbamoyl transferase component Bud32